MPHAPITELLPINETYRVGDTAKLVCRIIVSDSHPHIQWLRHHPNNGSYKNEDGEQYVQVVKVGAAASVDGSLTWNYLG